MEEHLLYPFSRRMVTPGKQICVEFTVSLQLNEKFVVKHSITSLYTKEEIEERRTERAGN